MIDVQETLDLRPGAAQTRQQRSQVGLRLRIRRVGPEQERDMLARLRHMSIQQEVGKQQLQGCRVDRLNRLLVFSEAKAAQELNTHGGVHSQYLCTILLPNLRRQQKRIVLRGGTATVCLAAWA